jgi:hypothetical protein
MFSLGACNASRNAPESAGSGGESGAGLPGPHVLVYKTRGDYSHRVPVILSEDKTKIVSYPHPADLKSGDGYHLPVSLKKGYWLDKKGISKNVAFLSTTYEEYASLTKSPDPGDLEKLILDRDPLVELYDCGNFTDYKDPVTEVNELIIKRKLKKTCLRIL